MSFQIGERVGDYEVIGILGAGGMGQVYKVRNIISDRIEAMKILLPNLESDPELGDRFMREIKVQASLDHPNIAGLHTAQRIGNQLVMIMEFVEGNTVESVLHKGPLPIPLAVDYTRQVLSALSYAHARGIIHRDIKPANMMVTSQGVIKLMDFGIAKLTADPKLTQTGHTVGSLYYMSPEQINGAATLDPRSDLYSLGVSLYEMVTGKRPFQGDSDYSIMAAHLNSTPVPPVEIDPRLPAALNEIILMSIAKDPARRFQTADAYRAALGNVASSLGFPAGAMGASVPPLVGGQPQVPMNGGPTPLMATALPTKTLPNAAPPVHAQAKASHRGLYMAVGSIVTVAVIAFAAIEGPKYFRSQGASGTPVSVAQSVPQSTPALTPSTPPVSAPDATPQTAPQTSTRGAQPAAQSGAPAAGSQPPTSGSAAPALPTLKAQLGRPRTEAARTANQAAAGPQNTAQISPPADTSQPAAPQGTPNAAELKYGKASLEELRERLMQMGTRAATVKKSIAALQAQQARSGMTMRGDITSSVSRMEFQLDEAEGSIRTIDPAKAKRNLDVAERELEKLEKFLGL